MDYIIQDHKPKFDAWFKILMAVPVCMALVTTTVMFINGSSELLETFAVCLFITLVIWLIIPRHYIIMDDKLKLVIGASLAINVPYRNIKELRKPSTVDLGVNFITSQKTQLEIVVKKGMNISIAPDDREAFVRDVNSAMQRWRRANNIND
jgi:hypothetical protein